MVTRNQKIEAIKNFLEVSAFAQIDGHSAHDGFGCKGHDEAFSAKAEELLTLIEEENYGYEPLLVGARSFQNGQDYDRRDLKSFLKALDASQFKSWTQLKKGQWITLLEYDNGSTAVEVDSPEDFELRQVERAREIQKNNG